MVFFCFACVVFLTSSIQFAIAQDIDAHFANPPESAEPWVFWYWMKGCVSEEGITADLESMKEIGIGGAYLMPIKGPDDNSLIQKPSVQLTPEWWEQVRHAFREADRLGLKFAMHACDGFAVAGGPWITPELSMQKVVAATLQVEGGRDILCPLPPPETNEGFYRDIAVLAFPSLVGTGFSTQNLKPKVTTSLPDVDASFLVSSDNDQRLRMAKPGWILYEFDEPYLCRSISVTGDGNNYQSHRLKIEVSSDGQAFQEIGQLKPPRQGWQSGSGTITHSIEPTTAKFFRFLFDKSGSEPGAEDLDAAKWSPTLKIKKIELSSEPRINQFRGKAGERWRVSLRTSPHAVPEKDCVRLETIIDLTKNVNDSGELVWNAPSGKWTVMRIGHTSTGARNETGGGGKGLECDKLNQAAVEYQFDQWFGEILRQIGPDLASRVLKVFHVDSWECDSQNWTEGVREQFSARRGYDPLLYLPAMFGVPVENVEVSEGFLHDMRRTIAEMLNENFFGTMAKLAHQKGCQFSAECVAPTMLSDGLRHFGEVDVPMGEFWLRSPTHDKPNDMLDAISGAHIYGKSIIQAEAYTQIRMDWGERPVDLKALGDLQFAKGINRFVFHVFMHNPWMDRKPGMTLDNIGLLFQRDQTWWQSAEAWMDYLKRCHVLLQIGKPVVDVAVFTGEELPRRSILPERLVESLPGLIGAEAVEREKVRWANQGEPLREMPRKVRHSANMANPEDWTDPLRGYAYDSINRDALLRLAKVEDGKVMLPGGTAYSLLVIPASRRMSPHSNLMSEDVADRILALADQGAKILICDTPDNAPGMVNIDSSSDSISRLATMVKSGSNTLPANGGFLKGPYLEDDLRPLGLAPDLIAWDTEGKRAKSIAWTHRRTQELELYFISNQLAESRIVEASFRIAGRVPELWDPLTGLHRKASDWKQEDGRTVIPVKLAANGSLFVVFRKSTDMETSEGKNWSESEIAQRLEGAWQVTFDASLGGPKNSVEFPELVDWTACPEDSIRYYSGTACYEKDFQWQQAAFKDQKCWLDLGKISAIATVYLNGKKCGTAWTFPFEVEITEALKDGENKLKIEVTNTWLNRRIGDMRLKQKQPITWTTAMPIYEDAELQESGVLGPVQIRTEIHETNRIKRWGYQETF